MFSEKIRMFSEKRLSAEVGLTRNIPLKFLRKIENTIFFPLVNSIRERTVYYATLQTLTHTYSSM
jgi:hypothetical protein